MPFKEELFKTKKIYAKFVHDKRSENMKIFFALTVVNALTCGRY